MLIPFAAVGIWIILLGLAMVSLLAAGTRTAGISGKIVLDYKPFCQHFVIETEEGFRLAVWEDGTLFFGEDDTVTGPLHTRGRQSIEVAGRGSMEVMIEDWFADPVSAQQAFRSRCQLAPSIPLVGTTLK